jgi:hypothetical protein
MHTPGPWTIEPHNIMQRIKAGKATVALPCMNDDVSAIQCGANARLIAAAPDMLAALQVAVSRVELANAEGNPILSAWLSDARAAIARATSKD